MPARQQQWETLVTVTDATGPMPLGLTDKWSGAGKDSDAKIYPRARGDLQLGGKATREPGKAEYLYYDIKQFAARLDNGVGSASVKVTRRELGDDKLPVVGGETITHTGILKAFSLPEGDAGSEDGAVCTLEFALDVELA